MKDSEYAAIASATELEMQPPAPQSTSYLQASLHIWDETYEIRAQTFEFLYGFKGVFLIAGGGLQTVMISIPFVCIPNAGHYQFNLHRGSDVSIWMGGAQVPIEQGMLTVDVKLTDQALIGFYAGRFSSVLIDGKSTFECPDFLFTSREREAAPANASLAGSRSGNEFKGTWRVGYNETALVADAFSVTMGLEGVFLVFQARVPVSIFIPHRRIPVSGSYSFDLAKVDDIRIIQSGVLRLPYGTLNVTVDKGDDSQYLRVEGSFRARYADLISSIVCDRFAISSRER
ncbi:MULTISPECIES: hypothetical protein [unclassified Pseudomonas]|uniref:hypothetical protein n=1 Tax=unclassified Pseudomonas TaxID=196821 RepID=UPI00087FAFEC|nr:MULTISPECIES: hypothetical protein [unclassified Pseudomonas]QVM98672.1 hypothetical protein JYG36_11070 [Pseudomonas sp. SORT22]UVL54455.1 hypothetical protein LOY22_16425 [Pseudomonas sp. B21-035]SDQ59719.1 hypothetical protein SAMN05216487_2751 [Pseudomonas sp. UC 17F4]